MEEAIEKIQEKYIKWEIRLNRNTPPHILLRKKDGDKIAIKQEQGLSNLKKRCSAWIGIQSEENVADFLQKRGWASQEAVYKFINGEIIWMELNDRSREI